MTQRQQSYTNLNFSDKFICGLDRALRTLTTGTQTSTRPSPANIIDEEHALPEDKRKHAAGLMRVNHSGEVCAQALYQGQSLSAKLPKVRKEMEEAADEEIDHLAWCEQRLDDLGESPSAFNPLWYTLSFGIGLSAGLVSDRLSLGFVAATEDQVCIHLREHLDSLPSEDQKSIAVVEQMLTDEEKHAHMALEAGGTVFPAIIKSAMTGVSKVMTTLSYKV